MIAVSLMAQAPPSADAYVTNLQPRANFGSSPLLPVQARTTSYVKLNLGAIPSNATITKATLRLYVNAVAEPGSFDVYQVEDTWSENTLNFYTAPRLGASATGGHPIRVTADSQNQYLLIDVTALAQAWLSGSVSNNGVALALTGATGSFSFDSKESGGRQPELEIAFDEAAAGSSIASVASGTSGSKLLAGQQAPSVPDIANSTALETRAGLSGIGAGLTWTVVTKSADYAIGISDFATPTTPGNYLILTGTTSHTFTLPNPPPSNGSCVAIGNVADPGINSNTNTFLKVNPNGVLMDTVTSGNSVVPTMPRRTAYLYCSDGAHYFRLGYQQNGPSEIGPWIKTYDTGTVNAMTSTFRNGMDFGLVDGTMIYLLPRFANTSNIVTLNLNGLGAFKVLKYGNQGLAPGDLSPNAYAQLIYNVNGTKWELLNPQTLRALPGTTASIGGSALTAGTCAKGTASVTNASIGHPVSVSASDGSLPSPFIILSAAVTSANTVTVQLCALAGVTPLAKTYNVVVH